MVTKTQLDTAATALKTTQTVFQTARQAKKDASGDYMPAAAGVRDFLLAARPIFVSSFGNRWSADWAAVGFVNHSTAVPATNDARLGLLDSVVAFLTANPSYEVAKSGVTAENGASIYNLAVEMEGAVLDAEQALRDAETARGPAEAALVQLMRALIRNLTGALAKDDPRWLAFGLNMPATKTTPGKPTGLAATFNPTTDGVILTCDAEPLAERFRFRGRVAGSGLPFQLVARSTQPTGRTKPFAPGTTMEFIVQAVNGGSQSVPSDSIFFTIPTAAQSVATPDGSPIVAPLAMTAPKNGSRNRNDNGAANGRGVVAGVR